VTDEFQSGGATAVAIGFDDLPLSGLLAEGEDLDPQES